MPYSSAVTAALAKSAAWKTTVTTELATEPTTLSGFQRRNLELLLGQADTTSPSYESLITTRVLTVDDNAKVFGLNLAAGFTVTLPLISTLPPNWCCEFFVETVNTGDYVIAANATDVDKIIGHVLSSGGAAEDTEATAGADQINLLAAAGVTKVGDWVKVRTNGIVWHARVETATAAAATFTG